MTGNEQAQQKKKNGKYGRKSRGGYCSCDDNINILEDKTREFSSFSAPYSFCRVVGINTPCREGGRSFGVHFLSSM